MKYGIGQKLILNQDLETEGCFGKKVTRKKGTEIFVQASKKRPSVIYRNGDIQMLPDDTEIEGFSVKGITDWIVGYLYRLPLDDMLDDYDIEIKEVKDIIEEALEELGFYNADGNID